jgi:hypothetical protein
MRTGAKGPVFGSSRRPPPRVRLLAPVAEIGNRRFGLRLLLERDQAALLKVIEPRLLGRYFDSRRTNRQGLRKGTHR